MIPQVDKAKLKAAVAADEKVIEFKQKIEECREQEAFRVSLIQVDIKKVRQELLVLEDKLRALMFDIEKKRKERDALYKKVQPIKKWEHRYRRSINERTRVIHKAMRLKLYRSYFKSGEKLTEEFDYDDLFNDPNPTVEPANSDGTNSASTTGPVDPPSATEATQFDPDAGEPVA